MWMIPARISLARFYTIFEFGQRRWGWTQVWRVSFACGFCVIGRAAREQVPKNDRCCGSATLWD
jgi:hypothetical protein